MNTLQRYHMVDGYNLKATPLNLCEACVYGKLTQTKFPKSQKRTKQLLELVHSDLYGPLPVTSLTGNYYFLTFMDDYSKYTRIYFLKNKSEVLTHFQHFVSFAERQTSKQLRIIRIDNGGDYVTKAFTKYCQYK
eukprot:c29883_g1_i1 orf=183-584(+)